MNLQGIPYDSQYNPEQKQGEKWVFFHLEGWALKSHTATLIKRDSHTTIIGRLQPFYKGYPGAKNSCNFLERIIQ